MKTASEAGAWCAGRPQSRARRVPELQRAGVPESLAQRGRCWFQAGARQGRQLESRLVREFQERHRQTRVRKAPWPASQERRALGKVGATRAVASTQSNPRRRTPRDSSELTPMRWKPGKLETGSLQAHVGICKSRHQVQGPQGPADGRTARPPQVTEQRRSARCQGAGVSSTEAAFERGSRLRTGTALQRRQWGAQAGLAGPLGTGGGTLAHFHLWLPERFAAFYTVNARPSGCGPPPMRSHARLGMHQLGKVHASPTREGGGGPGGPTQGAAACGVEVTASSHDRPRWAGPRGQRELGQAQRSPGVFPGWKR